MGAVRARWLDLGRLSPLRLHASYQALAEAAAPDDPPLLLWATSDRPHLSLGASQDAAAELDLAACRAHGVELVQRPLGGGTVLVDADQYCFFLVLPAAHQSGRPADVFELALPAAAAVFRSGGVPAERRGRTDLWVDGRKVLGSGAATLGRSLVFGSSFLLDFDAALFARLIRVPSAGFRDWLAEALGEGLAGWRAHATPPPADALQAALREVFSAHRAWHWEAGSLTAEERAAIAATETELEEERSLPGSDGGRRHVPDGIKINHGRYLVETHDASGWVRLDIAERRIRRIVAGGRHGPAPAACLGCEPEYDRLLVRLRETHSARRADGQGDRLADYWARRIDAVAAGVRRVWDV